MTSRFAKVAVDKLAELVLQVVKIFLLFKPSIEILSDHVSPFSIMVFLAFVFKVAALAPRHAFLVSNVEKILVTRLRSVSLSQASFDNGHVTI